MTDAFQINAPKELSLFQEKYIISNCFLDLILVEGRGAPDKLQIISKVFVQNLSCTGYNVIPSCTFCNIYLFISGFVTLYDSVSRSKYQGGSE